MEWMRCTTLLSFDTPCFIKLCHITRVRLHSAWAKKWDLYFTNIHMHTSRSKLIESRLDRRSYVSSSSLSKRSLTLSLSSGCFIWIISHHQLLVIFITWQKDTDVSTSCFLPFFSFILYLYMTVFTTYLISCLVLSIPHRLLCLSLLPPRIARSDASIPPNSKLFSSISTCGNGSWPSSPWLYT